KQGLDAHQIINNLQLKINTFYSSTIKGHDGPQLEDDIVQLKRQLKYLNEDKENNLEQRILIR
ncbi:4855_t:CDS:2, partial [Entrophospora sp. SA101]